MANKLEIKKHELSEFNNCTGNKYVDNDGIQPDTINFVIENSAWAQKFAEVLGTNLDSSEANNVGTATVTLVDKVIDGVSYKIFKFSNLKGNKGDKGDTGDKGEKGTEISNITSGSATTTDGITKTPVTVQYSDGKSTQFEVSAAQGVQGIQGNPVWVRYAQNNAGLGMSSTPTSETKYIGFYVGSTASEQGSAYTWSKYVGKQPSSVVIEGTNFIITWDDTTTTTVAIDVSQCQVATPVNGIVTSVNGKDGAVVVGKYEVVDGFSYDEFKNFKPDKSKNYRLTISYSLLDDDTSTDSKDIVIPTKYMTGEALDFFINQDRYATTGNYQSCEFFGGFAEDYINSGDYYIYNLYFINWGNIILETRLIGTNSSPAQVQFFCENVYNKKTKFIFGVEVEV